MEPRRAYKTDLTDAQWALIAPLLTRGHQPGHHRRKHSLREILNTLLYQLRTGCAWEHLPHDLLPKGTVYDYFHLWTRNGTFARIHTVLREQVREEAGREVLPSAAIVDTQSVKTTEKGGTPGSVGYDGSKHLKGRKRGLLVDTLGLVLAVKVVSAKLAEAAVAKRLFRQVLGDQERLELVWADGGFADRIEAWTEQECGWRVVVVKREPGKKGWQVLPKRWIVERTYGWLGRYRSLSKEYDYLPQSSESRIYLAMIHRMLCRLTS